jgi:hypothetical protein
MKKLRIIMLMAGVLVAGIAFNTVAQEKPMKEKGAKHEIKHQAKQAKFESKAYKHFAKNEHKHEARAHVKHNAKAWKEPKARAKPMRKVKVRKYDYE